MNRWTDLLWFGCGFVAGPLLFFSLLALLAVGAFEVAEYKTGGVAVFYGGDVERALCGGR